MKLQDIMAQDVIQASPDETVSEAAKRMREQLIKRLPAADRGKLRGIISLSDHAALGSVETEKLRSSLRYFTDVVCAHSSLNVEPLANAPTHSVTASIGDEHELADISRPG